MNLFEKETRLKEIAAKMEPKAFGKIKDGRIFRREDVTPSKRRLIHEGMVNWKAASGRLKGMFRSNAAIIQTGERWQESDFIINTLFLTGIK